jgi:fructuronate reductase
MEGLRVMVKISDNYLTNSGEFTKLGIKVPTYEQDTIIEKTKKEPRWVHFGGGNLFRAFHAAIANKLIDDGKMETGVTVVETYDQAVIPDIYDKYKNRIVRVITKADGTQERELFASVGEAIFAGPTDEGQKGFDRLKEIFTKDSLQVASFSITEKGYNLKNGSGEYFPAVAEDIKNGPKNPKNNMTALVSLLFARYETKATPLTLLSTDNFSQNGDRLKATVLEIANAWKDNGFVDDNFISYLSDSNKIAFPLSMIDRITPNPSDKISDNLKKDGFEDASILHTPQHTNIAAFTNTEEAHYLVVEDSFPNGRPEFEKAGVIMADRDTVNSADEMKVTTCLNPLHTALAVFGCVLGFKSIASEMEDEDLVGLIKKIGYTEGLPVVKDPKVINPKEFIDELLTKRLPNPYIPDAPQRIATDTSQKLAIRYGVTIKHYVENPSLDPKTLKFIPLVVAAWLRYLMAIDDSGKTFEPSPDPLFDELHEQVKNLSLGNTDNNIHDDVKNILSNKDIFGIDLYQVGLAEKVEADFKDMLVGEGAIKATLHKALQ